MSISLDNSTNSINFGPDAPIKRSAPAELTLANSVKVSSAGVTFPDGTLQATASMGGGASGPSTLYDTTVKYMTNTTDGQSGWATTSAPVRLGISWTRSGTSVVLTDPGHGHLVGNRVIARNINADYVVASITAVTTDTFTIATTDAGPTSGTTGAYSMGYTYAQNAAVGSITGGSFVAPSGVGSAVTLLSLRLRLAANTRTGTTYRITIPAQPTGPWTSLDNIAIPQLQVRLDGITLSAQGPTLAAFAGSDWQAFQLGALPAATSGILIQLQF